MRIGELGERTGLSTKAIRYYEQAGLLPAPARTGAGYRDYESSAEDRLAFIKAAQSVGFSLGEIREILAFRDRGEQPCVHVTNLIEKHATDLAERIEVLRGMESDLRRLATIARTSPHGTGQFCHIIEIGRAATISGRDSAPFE